MEALRACCLLVAFATQCQSTKVDQLARASVQSQVQLSGQVSPEEEACKQPLSSSGKTSEDEPEPAVVQTAAPGERVRMTPFESMEYQLFLPENWKGGQSADMYPVVVFLHGYGDGKFSVMNSQSLPRLLAKDQSTVFDTRKCWCLESDYKKVTAMREAQNEQAFLDEQEDLASPLADCDFASTFQAIVVMPQGWLPDGSPGWTDQRLEKVERLTRHVMQTYRGDPSRVTLSGQSMGGAGAWKFASLRPDLWAAVNVICAPTGHVEDIAEKLSGRAVWVVGWTGDGEAGNDEVVQALKQRSQGSVRYTRYTKAPPPPDPQYRDMLNHASYDLIYRDPRLWTWAFEQRNPEAPASWNL
eukprot:TRINITY_DN66814_c0_g1_i1.p1 TRINITY_DN66814_c0_g1~~TRINITY_DN66814_c0_g1_i1.p1  ORF type:complete len:357 (-),score=67.71 TRINITY_DN66814_c0_g1_i1:105-1175(-)